MKGNAMQHIAIYERVSTPKQDTRSQTPDLKQWVSAYADIPVKWYRDTWTDLLVFLDSAFAVVRGP